MWTCCGGSRFGWGGGGSGDCRGGGRTNSGDVDNSRGGWGRGNSGGSGNNTDGGAIYGSGHDGIDSEDGGNNCSSLIVHVVIVK